MKRTIALILLLVVACPVGAVNVEPEGVGGGGWLYSAAFSPLTRQRILIGSDMAGVHRTFDGGSSWETFNTGMPVVTGAQTSYVQDLISFEFDRTEYYYAATLGGIFHATLGSNWLLNTAASMYNFTSTQNDDEVAPIPFACLDECDGIIVAGAGVNRWEKKTVYIDLNGVPDRYTGYGLHAAYPSLCDTSLSASTPSGGQWTVWIKDLNDQGLQIWTPYDLDSGNSGQNEFGAARDIDITEVDGTTYVVVATIDGVFLHNMVQGTDWIDLTARDAYYPDTQQTLQNRGNLREMGPGMRPWSVKLTSRGTLYAAMERIADQDGIGDPVSGGVYRLYDVADTAGTWTWLGDDDQLPAMVSDYDTMREIGEDDDEAEALAHQIFMNVVEVDAVEPGSGPADIVFLGDRRNRFGLMRGIQPYQSTVDCEWVPLVFGEWYNQAEWHRTYNPDTQTESDLLEGWKQWGSMPCLFQPAVSTDHAAEVDSISLIWQGGARLYVTDDGGATWQQSYSQEPNAGTDAGPWRTRGYNEQAVVAMDYLSDGRLVFASRDVGAFVESPTNSEYYDHIEIPIGAAAWNDSTAAVRHTEGITTVPDWAGSGSDAVFVLAGRNSDYNKSTKVIMYHNGSLSHATATCGLDTLNGGTAKLELFNIVFRDSATCIAGYRSRSLSSQYNCGFLKGTYNSGWQWSRLDTGYPGSGEQWRTPRDLIHHEQSGRMFTVCSQGVYALEADEVGGWTRVYGSGTGEATYRDANCIAQAADGSRLYVGTKGGGNCVGTILVCENPSAALDSLQWYPMVNTASTSYPFGLITPYFDSSITSPDEQMPAFSSITVDPSYADRFYCTVRFGDFHPKQGVWSYNHSGCEQWRHLTGDNELIGAFFYDSAIDASDSDQLHLASCGLGVYTLDLTSIPNVTCGGGGGHEIGIGFRRGPSQGPGGHTTFYFDLPKAAQVELSIYDVRGYLVSRSDYGLMQAGSQIVQWTGTDSSGRRAASSVYFARLKAGRDEGTVRFVLLK